MRSAESNSASLSHVPGSNHAGSSSRVHLSAKLRNRLEKLAEWRISPSLFEFPEGSPEFHGGYATVSRALLYYSRENEEGVDALNNGGDEVEESNSCNLKLNDGLSNSENSNKCEGGERSNEETTSKGEDATEGRKQGSDGEASGRWMAVAVKKMKISGDLTLVLGLTLREADFLVELEHENIIEPVGFVEDVSKNMIWLVFPWEDNGNLKGFIASVDWEIPERISLINDVARGVEYLHSRQPPICHGDLKSINILVNSGYRAVITDFGSARRLVTNDLKVAGERTEVKLQTALSPEVTFCASTNTITLTGDNYTLRWAAPELLKEEESGTACDIWALGWVAYEVMTSFIPFQDVKDAIVITRVVRGDLPSISNDVRMLLIQALCSLMIKCWSIDPSKRPTTEDCRQSINWMPMITPNPRQREDTDGSGSRSPELLIKLGEMHMRQNDYPEAKKYFTEALDIYEHIVDRVGEANALFELARIHWLQRKYNQAIPLFSEAFKIYRDLHDRDGRARIFWNLAEICRHQDKYDRAIALFTEALEIWTNIGNGEGRADALGGLAEVCRIRGEYSEAIPLYSEELQIRTEIGDRQGRAEALWGLAEMYRLQKDYSQAITLYSEALQIQTGIGDRRGRAEALWSLAEVYRLQKEYSQAITFYSEALEICTGIGDKYRKALALEGLADVHRDQDHHSDAIHYYEQAAETFKQIRRTMDAANASKQAANVHRLLTQKKAA